MPALRSRQVNLVLAIAVGGLLVTGLVSWAVGTGWNRWWAVAHGVFGFTVVVLTPIKSSTSVRAGLRRRRPSRWLSIALGVLVLSAAVLGVLHSTGLWHGHGYWSPLWWHVATAFAAAPIVVWHMASRPARPRRTDLDRRLLLGTGVRVLSATAIVFAVESFSRVVGLAGAHRRFTGSYPIGSYDPDTMPTVSWIDDATPEIDPADWPLRIAGEQVDVEALRARCTPVTATLDCTGGWYSTHEWDAVSVADLLGNPSQRSFIVTSATGYRRVYPMSDASCVFVAVGYDGRPLRPGHGAPARLIAPGRRGPWWVKWVVDIDPIDRPAWLQLPFPAT
ncbi:MAG: molybdopterin-dependent oxidoreductase [Ilumatobacteraceae bacterium]